jgi:hypothetical protein
LRRLLADWQFSAGAIAILALGIGANTAVFSLLNNTLFQPHPFRDSRRLVNIYQNESKAGEPEGVSYPAFLDLQKETSVFTDVAASHMTEGRYQVEEADGHPGTARGLLLEYATANHLNVLGMRPSLGRWFTPDEEQARRSGCRPGMGHLEPRLSRLTRACSAGRWSWPESPFG